MNWEEVLQTILLLAAVRRQAASLLPGERVDVSFLSLAFHMNGHRYDLTLGTCQRAPEA